MKVTFLGTGTSQGVPVIACQCEVCTSLDFRDQRLRTSVHLHVAGKSIVIDTGPDFRQQMLRANIQALDAIVYTHQHKDHTAGLDDIRPFFFRQGKQDIPVFARQQVIEQLKMEFAYMFTDHKYPGVPSVSILPIVNEPFEVAGTLFTPIEVMHYQMPVFGFRIADFTYITDANFIADHELQKVKGSKVLVINALQHKEHISHFTLQQALEVIRKVKPEKAYLTHISHRLGLQRVLESQLPNGVELAYDGLSLEL